MEYPLGLLVVFLVLFAPLGLAIHWLVLGASARVYALPLALTTGLAAGVILLAAGRQAGIEPGSPVLPILLLLVLVAMGVVIRLRRWNVAWRSRELIGTGILLLITLIVLGMPLVERAGEGATALTGPLAYGTGFEPVEQVATAESAANTDAKGELGLVRRAAASADDRYTGFEQLLGMVVGMASPGSDSESASEWSAYTLHAPLLALIAALFVLPIFVLARWRGLRWLGLLGAVLLGVTSPLLLASAGLAQAPGVLAALFTVCALTSLLLARRDRGWMGLAAIYAGATLVAGGPLAFVPFITVGVAWILLRGSTREHLASTDTPTSADRPIAAAVLAAMFSLYGVIGAMVDGVALPWKPMHDTILGAATAWPLSWIGPGLDVQGPEQPWEQALVLVGPALLLIGAFYGVSRSERRELAIILGGVAAVAVGVVVALFDRDTGIVLLEYSLLALAPLLAIVCVRTVAVAREARETKLAGKEARFAGVGPLLMLGVLLVLSLSAAGSSGVRTVHAPPLGLDELPAAKTLVAAGDPWLGYVVDGERAAGGDTVDADALSHAARSVGSVLYGEYQHLVFGTNPLGSDPTSRYVENSSLDEYGARLFVDTWADGSAARAREGTEDGEDGKDGGRLAVTDPIPDRHHPAEEDDAADRKLGGLLVPPGGIDRKRCSLANRGLCEPAAPLVSKSCKPGDAGVARSILDRKHPGYEEPKPREATPEELGDGISTLTAGVGAALGEAGDQAQQQQDQGAGTSGSDDQATELPGGEDDSIGVDDFERPLLGVTCWEVELGNKTKGLRVHLRDVGLILSATDAFEDGPVKKEIGSDKDAVFGGDWVTTSGDPVRIEYGQDSLAGTFDVTLEGDFGTGADLVFSAGNTSQESTTPLQTAWGGFSPIQRERAILGGNLAVEAATGSAIRVGRVFVRPADTLARSCDLALEVGPGADEEGTELVLNVADEDDQLVQIPGLVLRVAEETRDDPGEEGVKGKRKVRLVLGSYLQRYGMPRHVLVDWTEEFEDPIEQGTCAQLDRPVTDALPGGGTEPAGPGAGGAG